MSGKTSFTLYKRAISSFQLFITGMSEVVTWSHFFRIRSRIVAAFTTSLSILSLIDIKTSILASFVTSDGIYSTFEIRLLMSAISRITAIVRPLITIKLRNTYRTYAVYTAVIPDGGIKISVQNVFDIQNFRFRILSYFDGTNLGSLDGLTLGDMDQGI